MVESNNNEELRLRVARTLQRLVKATAELEALTHPKAIVELAPLMPRDPRKSPHNGDRL